VDFQSLKKYFFRYRKKLS